MASSLLPPLLVSRLLLLLLLLASTTREAVAAASHQLLHVSTISAAPAVLPSSPASSPLLPLPPPALSPDAEPLLPSPGGSSGSESPTESTLPIIPSSPSPPNPDDVTAPQPEVALGPSSSLPVSASLGNQPASYKNAGQAFVLLLCWLPFFA
ncbi:hypothetical protein MLD38_026401 [Melastoma candidum]|uniref:Uncharacterized protein n=1 Tax=Melastoma candidum TaxID=119954 RepID=A0ACB9P1Z4_9MYRT|nr:hypothetical protein MLD38_026401 [Melastoma candidum]